MSSIPAKPTLPDPETRLALTGRSLMSRWETIRFYCKLTWLAFCLRPLPHFRPSLSGVPARNFGKQDM
jgi:hypothetical protein